MKIVITEETGQKKNRYIIVFDGDVQNRVIVFVSLWWIRHDKI
jgi:hypothetical protein